MEDKLWLLVWQHPEDGALGEDAEYARKKSTSIGSMSSVSTDTPGH